MKKGLFLCLAVVFLSGISYFVLDRISEPTKFFGVGSLTPRILKVEFLDARKNLV